jgi:hypothetical protein
MDGGREPENENLDHDQERADLGSERFLCKDMVLPDVSIKFVSLISQNSRDERCAT